MVKTIYTGPNNPKQGLFTYTIYTEQFPPDVAAAIKANPGLRRYFISFEEEFVKRRPPGAPVPRSGGAPPRVRGTPIKQNKPVSFITIGKK